MHELSIATAIVESVEKESAMRGDARMLTVGLRIGELSGVDEDSLLFGWEALTRGTKFEGLKLKIKWIPWVHRCEQCKHEFQIVSYETQCPTCGDVRTKLLRGNELDLTYIEIEEPELAHA